MAVINNPNYLKYMMSFDADGAGTGTVQRTTSIQPVASNIELRTIASSQVLPHPPATPLCGPLSRVSSNRCYLRRCCSTTYSPTTPRLTRIIQTVRNIYSMTAVVTLGTGMSCISSVCRNEDNGSDNEDNLDDRQQRPNSSSPKRGRASTEQVQLQVRLFFFRRLRPRRDRWLPASQIFPGRQSLP